MAVAALFARTAQRYAVQQGNVVAQHGGFADNDARAVVKHDAMPEHGSGVDVHAKYFAGAVLQKIGKRLAVVVPQPMVDAVRLDGVVAFEIEQGQAILVAGGVAVVARGNVGNGGFYDVGAAF